VTEAVHVTVTQLLRAQLTTVAGYVSPPARTRGREAWQRGFSCFPKPSIAASGGGRWRATMMARVLGLGILRVKIQAI
jgi:hypothetical protein